MRLFAFISPCIHGTELIPSAAEPGTGWARDPAGTRMSVGTRMSLRTPSAHAGFSDKTDEPVAL